jgi:predicted butyrate kinase (DUF1464 family)
MVRAVGSDPGTSGLDLLLLDDGAVVDQRSFQPADLARSPGLLSELFEAWAPIDMAAAPSGYGLPLVRGEALTEDHIEQMSLVRPSDRGRESGVVGFRAWVRAFCRSGVPVVFTPGGLHLPTIPAHRKVNSVDLGTADKVCVAALALWFDLLESGGFDRSTFAVIEVGTAFSAILVVERGQLVDASAGTRGPIGIRSQGSWDGEIAYWRGPLTKNDLFRGGLSDLRSLGPDAFRESLVRHLAAMQAITPFERIYLSGRGLTQPEVAKLVDDATVRFDRVIKLPNLPGASVKHAAQGSAILADALAGGRFAPLAESLHLTSAAGSVWDWLMVQPAGNDGVPDGPR